LATDQSLRYNDTTVEGRHQIELRADPLDVCGKPGECHGFDGNTCTLCAERADVERADGDKELEHGTSRLFGERGLNLCALGARFLEVLLG
jgi:hypothetical protein